MGDLGQSQFKDRQDYFCDKKKIDGVTISCNSSNLSISCINYTNPSSTCINENHRDKCSNSNVWTCCIENISDELEALIENRLAKICHGYDKVNSNSNIYNYERTLKSLLKNISEKPEKIKMGMISELLAHILITEEIDFIETISPLFNKEEYHIKKGFDIILSDKNNDNIWFTEVKSGNVEEGEKPQPKNQKLIGTARDDFKQKLIIKERNLMMI